MAATLSGQSRQRMILVFLSLVMAVGAVMVMRQYLVQQRIKLQREWERLTADLQTPTEVVVAAEDLPDYVTLESLHLTTATIPEKFVQPYSVGSSLEVLGKVTIAPIAKGEQILLTKVRDSDDVPRAATLSALTPKDKRAVTIGMDALTGVGGFVRPGDSVDVLWTVPLPEEQGGTANLALLQDVLVLAVGNQMVGKSRGDQETAQNYTVTLALSPEETSVLMFARQIGGVQLSLRSHVDTGDRIAATPLNYRGVLRAVLGDQAVPEPSPPPEPYTVEVYKGLERSVVSLNE